MKKFSLIVAVLLLAAPALAQVDITCECADGVVTISYDAGTDTVRAFALDITVAGGTITGYDTAVTYDPNYNIYPGSISIVDGEVNDLGTPIGDPNDHVDTKAGLGTDAVTIEMGALYDLGGAAPPSSGQLIKLMVDGGTTVTIEENDARGGVVLTDGSTPGINSPGCECGGCFPACHPDYDTWDSLGGPECWCGSGRQCHGDADGLEQTVGKYKYWVSNNDLLILADGYGKRPYNPSDPCWAIWICADFDHKEQTVGKYKYRVSNDDLLILADYYGVRPIDANCLDCP
jgi:hypothetical protein